MTQNEGLEILKRGHNAFITGAAGSGKTFLLNRYINYLKRNNIEAAITASTGIAATHIGGLTIHSWTGLGVRDTLDERTVKDLKDRYYLKSRYKKAEVLIIDEISMLSGNTLDLIDFLFREFKNTNLPFGGIQTVLCGDFFQLPPVRRVNLSFGGSPVQTGKRYRDHSLFSDDNDSPFAFRSRAWQELGLKICYLDEQHRQNDSDFIDVLNAIRNNAVTSRERKHLENRIESSSAKKTEQTKLYCLNADVDLENALELKKIPGKERVYKMEARGGNNLVETVKRGCLAPEVLKLKAGARVMFVKNNFEEGYVNGTLGVVEDLDEDRITVFASNGRRFDVGLANWIIEENGRIKAEIIQYPLRLAWAITVHKSQGMSLDAARIDLTRSFEKGMGYVALSRVRSLKGLSLAGFNENALQVNEEVLTFDAGFKKESVKHAEEIRKKVDFASLKNEEEIFSAAGWKPERRKKISTYDQTKVFVERKMSLEEIAKTRKLTIGTVLSHLEKLKEKGKLGDVFYLREKIGSKRIAGMENILLKFQTDDGKYPLAEVKEQLGDAATYEELRVARLFLE
jgi:ATP-dependent exoDNAse (exonuclease V) alpha subunit